MPIPNIHTGTDVDDTGLHPVLRKIAIDASYEAGKLAHAPFSGFHVGASIVWPDRTVVNGCNVESASYGLTCCGERTAMFSAIAQGKDLSQASALCVTCLDLEDLQADPNGFNPSYVMPCGACRQVMSELLGDCTVVIVNGVGEFFMSELLPQAFALK